MDAGASDPDSARTAAPAGLPFHDLAQHLATPCWISDPEGLIVWVNDAWIGYTGWDVEKVRAEGLKPLHGKSTYGDVVRRWQEVKAAGISAEMVFPLLGTDGALRPFHTRVTPVRDAKGIITHWFGVNTDVSAQSETEARLRASDEQLREMFERAGDGIFITDAQGQLVDANAAACALGQFTREELLAKTVWQLIDQGEQDALAEARESDDSIRDWKIRRKDGSLLEVEVSSRRLSDGRRLGVARDVSAQRRLAETEKRALSELVTAQTARASEAERQLQHFWDASRDLFAVVSNTDGIARLINAGAWDDLLGYPAEQITRTRLIDFVHPDDLDMTIRTRESRLGQKAYFGFENRFRKSDGGFVWLSWNVVREGEQIYCCARDITEEKLAQDKLARSERQFRLLVAGVVDYALFMLSPDGVVTNWNAGAERIKGYAADEIVGKSFSVFYTEADRAAGQPELALATATEHGRYESEGWRVRKDGGLFWANGVIDAIYDETGQLVGFAKITRDITERREAQLELQRANERLAHAQKMEALGQLTGGVAHDFNNLLMVMGGQAELLRGRIGDNPRALRSLDAIVAAARRGQDLTRHLLAFGRRQRLNPAPVSLASRAADLRALLTSSLGVSVAVSVDCPDDLWTVEVDVNEWELAVLNMAVNSRDAMPEGGSLSIKARNVVLPAEGADVDLRGEFVEFRITDTGAGIPADILPKVVEPFFTTKEVSKGTGLGLSQVYGFVQQSGGVMTVQSQLGQGTTITLYLPRSAGSPAAAPQPSPAAAPRSLHILCVEDNPEVADVAAALLEQMGHSAQVANSASAAVRMLEEGARPDLVFSDIVMAGEMDGLGLARHIRGRWPGLPVLLATGYSRAAEGIGDEFLIVAKPYQAADLSDALDATFNARR
jgi:PAS domain S-box-containing protein